MDTLTLDRIDELLQRLAGTPLHDPALPTRVIEAPVERGIAVPVDDVTFSIAAFSTVDVTLFNAPDDVDEDGVIGSGDASERSAPDAPLIAFDPDRCWLKYRARLGAKASGAATLAGAGFAFDAEQTVLANAYRVHAPDERMRAAIVEDLAAFPVIARLDDVLALEPGEALSLHVRGRLDADLSLSWADVFAGRLQQLSHLIDAQEVVAVEIDAAATATFDVHVSDDFLLAFTRVDDDTYRVAVKKATSRSRSGSAGARVHVALADPAAAEDALNAVLKGLLGRARHEVEALLDCTGTDDLTDAQRDLLEWLVRRLGLEAAVDRLEALRERWQTLQDDARDAIHAAATAQAELSVGYEYSRLRTSSELLDAQLSRDAVERFHGDLLRFRLRPLLSHARDGRPGVRIGRYLNEATLKARRVLGFSLSLGGWTAASEDVKAFEQVKRQNIDGRQQVAFLATRSYTSAWRGSQVRWLVDLDAAMPRFSQQPTPTAAEFDYRMALVWDQAEQKLTSDELRALIDHGILWAAVPPGDASRLHDHLTHAVGPARDVRFTFQITVDPVAFTELLPFFALDRDEGIAEALGRAMPWWKDFDERTVVALRGLHYGALWKFYLEHPTTGVRGLAATAEAHLTAAGFKALGRREGDYLRFNKVQQEYLFAGIAEMNGGTAEQWTSFRRGAKRLQDARTAAEPYDVLNGIFRDMQRFWHHSHHVRALGAYITAVADARPDIAQGLSSTLSIRYVDDAGAEQVITVTRS